MSFLTIVTWLIMAGAWSQPVWAGIYWPDVYEATYRRTTRTTSDRVTLFFDGESNRLTRVVSPDDGADTPRERTLTFWGGADRVTYRYMEKKEGLVCHRERDTTHPQEAWQGLWERATLMGRVPVQGVECEHYRVTSETPEQGRIVYELFWDNMQEQPRRLVIRSVMGSTVLDYTSFRIGLHEETVFDRPYTAVPCTSSFTLISPDTSTPSKKSRSVGLWVVLVVGIVTIVGGIASMAFLYCKRRKASKVTIRAMGAFSVALQRIQQTPPPLLRRGSSNYWSLMEQGTLTSGRSQQPLPK